MDTFLTGYYMVIPHWTYFIQTLNDNVKHHNFKETQTKCFYMLKLHIEVAMSWDTGRYFCILCWQCWDPTEPTIWLSYPKIHWAAKISCVKISQFSTSSKETCYANSDILNIHWISTKKNSVGTLHLCLLFCPLPTLSFPFFGPCQSKGALFTQ